MTYNHAAYIEDAMIVFCMQKTSFPYVAIIVDIASTDGESGIIQNYMDTHFYMLNAQTWDTEDATFIETVHLANKKIILQ